MAFDQENELDRKGNTKRRKVKNVQESVAIEFAYASRKRKVFRHAEWKRFSFPHET